MKRNSGTTAPTTTKGSNHPVPSSTLRGSQLLNHLVSRGKTLPTMVSSSFSSSTITSISSAKKSASSTSTSSLSDNKNKRSNGKDTATHNTTVPSKSKNPITPVTGTMNKNDEKFFSASRIQTLPKRSRPPSTKGGSLANTTSENLPSASISSFIDSTFVKEETQYFSTNKKTKSSHPHESSSSSSSSLFNSSSTATTTTKVPTSSTTIGWANFDNAKRSTNTDTNIHKSLTNGDTHTPLHRSSSTLATATTISSVSIPSKSALATAKSITSRVSFPAPKRQRIKDDLDSSSNSDDRSHRKHIQGDDDNEDSNDSSMDINLDKPDYFLDNLAAARVSTSDEEEDYVVEDEEEEKIDLNRSHGTPRVSLSRRNRTNPRFSSPRHRQQPSTTTLTVNDDTTDTNDEDTDDKKKNKNRDNNNHNDDDNVAKDENGDDDRSLVQNTDDDDDDDDDGEDEEISTKNVSHRTRSKLNLSNRTLLSAVKNIDDDDNDNDDMRTTTEQRGTFVRLKAETYHDYTVTSSSSTGTFLGGKVLSPRNKAAQRTFTWMGPLLRTGEDKCKYYSAFALGGFVYSIGQYVEVTTERFHSYSTQKRNSNGTRLRITPGRIESIWERSTDNTRWIALAWCYHPEDTPHGKMPVYGNHEVFLSSHIDAVSIDSIERRANVVMMNEFFNYFPHLQFSLDRGKSTGNTTGTKNNKKTTKTKNSNDTDSYNDIKSKVQIKKNVSVDGNPSTTTTTTTTVLSSTKNSPTNASSRTKRNSSFVNNADTIRSLTNNDNASSSDGDDDDDDDSDDNDTIERTSITGYDSDNYYDIPNEIDPSITNNGNSSNALDLTKPTTTTNHNTTNFKDNVYRRIGIWWCRSFYDYGTNQLRNLYPEELLASLGNLSSKNSTVVNLSTDSNRTKPVVPSSSSSSSSVSLTTGKDIVKKLLQLYEKPKNITYGRKRQTSSYTIPTMNSTTISSSVNTVSNQEEIKQFVTALSGLFPIAITAGGVIGSSNTGGIVPILGAGIGVASGSGAIVGNTTTGKKGMASLPRSSSSSSSSTLDAAKEERDALFHHACTQLQLSTVPDSLPCRENEKTSILSTLEGAIKNGGLGTALYISGMPGTGKTVTVSEVIRELRTKMTMGTIPEFRYIEINAMKLASPNQLYTILYRALTGETLSTSKACTALDSRFSMGVTGSVTYHRNTVTSKDKTVTILLVDELDYLVTRNQSVLYNIFDWPTRPQCQLIVIGIANTMDMPEKLLPKVASRLGLGRVVFAPYTDKQIEAIITTRLSGMTVFDPESITMAAKKVSGISGDIRRALHICRRATELAHVRTTNGGLFRVTIADVKNAAHEMASDTNIRRIMNSTPHEKLLLIMLAYYYHTNKILSPDFVNLQTLYNLAKTIVRTHANIVPTTDQNTRSTSTVPLPNNSDNTYKNNNSSSNHPNEPNPPIDPWEAAMIQWGMPKNSPFISNPLPTNNSTGNNALSSKNVTLALLNAALPGTYPPLTMGAYDPLPTFQEWITVALRLHQLMMLSVMYPRPDGTGKGLNFMLSTSSLSASRTGDHASLNYTQQKHIKEMFASVTGNQGEQIFVRFANVLKQDILKALKDDPLVKALPALMDA